MGFGAGTAFGNMGVSVRRAEMPIKKFKNISDCPYQGSLSVAFTNASIFGSQSAASVAVCACAWEKKRTKKEDRNNQTRSPQACCGQKCQGDPDCFWEALASRAKGYAAGRSTGRQHRSTKPGLTLQYQLLHPGNSGHSPQGLLAPPGSSSLPRPSEPCVWQAQHYPSSCT